MDEQKIAMKCSVRRSDLRRDYSSHSLNLVVVQMNSLGIEMNENQYEPPITQLDSNRNESSVARGCGFGCLYMAVAFIGFGVLVGLVAPLIVQDNLEMVGQVGSRIGMFLIAPIAGLAGFLRHRRRKT